MISQDLLNILVCPETKEPVQYADSALLAKLNAEISAGRMKNRGGQPVNETLDGALVRKDGAFAYPVRKDIPVMLVDEALPLH